MKVVLPLAYLGNIDYYLQLANAEEVLFEQHEHFVKQSFRSRCFIYGANGKLNLSVPIHRNNSQRTKITDIRVNNDERWQKLHWRSLESAYRSSPYFEFYEDDLAPFYQKEFKYLWDLNESLQDLLLQWLQLDINSSYTSNYQKNYEDVIDFRSILHPKQPPTFSQTSTIKYLQVFENKCGYLPNLSIVDLLFNEGPNANSILLKTIKQSIQ